MDCTLLFFSFIKMEHGSHFPGKTTWQGWLKVQLKPVKEEGVRWPSEFGEIPVAIPPPFSLG